jgi:hypothetical protein
MGSRSHDNEQLREDKTSIPADETSGNRTFVSLGTAIRYGVLAGLGTYGAVVVFLAIHVFVLPASTLSGVGIRLFAYGTLGDFLGTHYATTSGVVLGGAGAGTVPVALYYLAPLLSLGVCGHLCAATTTAETTDETVLNGAAIALGYALVVCLCLWCIYVVVPIPPLGLDPLRAVLVAGVVYPLVFGGLGGFSTRFSDESSRR